MRRFRLLGIIALLIGFATTAHAIKVEQRTIWQGDCTLEAPVSITIVDSEFARPMTTTEPAIIERVLNLTGESMLWKDMLRTEPVVIDRVVTWLVVEDKDGSVYFGSILFGRVTGSTYLTLTDDLKATLFHPETGAILREPDWRCGVWHTKENVYEVLLKSVDSGKIRYRPSGSRPPTS